MTTTSSATSPPLAADYLNAPAPAQAFKDAGYVAVLRYERNTTKTDVAQAHAAGLGWATIFETSATEALLGRTKGVADGTLFRQALQSLGQPTGTYVTFNIADFKPTSTQLPALAAYRWGFESALTGYVFGPYGTGYVISQLAQEGELWWQNAENNSPSGTGGPGTIPGDTVQVRAALYQRVTPTLTVSGASVGSWDEDVVVNGASVPWWLPEAPTPAPTPTPTPTPSPASPALVAVVKTVSIKTGEGWCACPMPAHQVVNAVPFDQNPSVIGRYPNIPDFAGAATQPGNTSPHGVLTFRGGADGVYGVRVWATT